MRLPFVFVCLAALCASASARPLPDGVKVLIVKGRPMVKRGAATVALLDDERLGAGSKITAELSDDGATLHATWQRCAAGDDTAEEADVPLAHVVARLENFTGMASHLKKKYADAIPHFAAAAEDDPDEPVFATNLLSAQSMAGKLDDADQTLATYGPKNPAWFAWRLAVDSDLANVKARPAATALLAQTPGTAHWSDLDGNAAFAGALAAVELHQGNGGPGAPGEDDLVVYDTAGARELLRLPVVTAETACDDQPPDPCSPSMLPKCTKKQLTAREAAVKAADAVLASLGFVVAPGAFAEIPLDGTAEVKSPDGKLTIVTDSSRLHVTPAKGKRYDLDRDERVDHILFGKDDKLLVVAGRSHIFLCDDDSWRQVLEPAK